jgi:preprotein translocase subunit SecB
MTEVDRAKLTEVDRTKPPGIQVAQILLEHVQFSHRDDFLSLPLSTPPVVGNVNVQVETGLSPDAKTGLVRVQVWTVPENKPIYNFRVSMTALVAVDQTAPNMPLNTYLAGPGAALLYPFVREVVADLTWRARFGPVWLSPTNVLVPAAVAPETARLPAKAAAKAPPKRAKVRRKR